jgi:hypothetical protein
MDEIELILVFLFAFTCAVFTILIRLNAASDEMERKANAERLRREIAASRRMARNPTHDTE